MKRSVLVLGIIALLIFGMSLASFGDNQWVSIGPQGMTVKAIAIDPQTPETVYIGTADFGVFKSIDGGENWTPVNTGLSNLNIAALAIDPQTPETIYAGITGDGVFRSIDGGMTWESINTGLPSSSVDAIVINPMIPATIYAGTGGVFTDTLYYGFGAFKSIDGGLTWTPINAGLPVPGSVTALAINPQTPETLYAGAYRAVFDSALGVGVLKSSDGGMNWIATTLSQIDVFALAIDPQTPETIYAGTIGYGVFKSTDGGTTWTTINTGLTDLYVWALTINPQSPNILYAGTKNRGGVFRSIDGGMTWVAINAGLPLNFNGVEVLAINFQTPEILYAGTDGFGLFKINMGAGPINSTLAVSKSGTGNGTVTSDPAGINCGTSCSGSYIPGTLVTLTATADSGSTFAGWSGPCSGTGTCSVTMDSDKTVVGVFNLQQEQYVLTVIKSGTGNGMVTSSPVGISCGTNCSETYSRVQKVRLTAKPDADSKFSGWSGGSCSDTGICNVTVDSPTVITADFPKKVSHISVSPASIDFGDIKMGRNMRKRLAITNNGTGDLLVTAGGLEGTDFSISGRTSATVKPKRTINLSVVFKPTSPGPHVTLLKITSNGPDKPLIDVPLTGTSGPAR